jgi:hypothetical protein
VLSVAVVLLFAGLAWAAAWDALAWRRGRRFRSSRQMAAERYDLHLDMASTQHRGISTPIDDICRDRHRGR